ncbi:MAG TPA: EamA family transporter [Nocardioidaceae bacterium]|nr:EamA family transporter [Nocardioidaceae bacterium]
MALLLAGLAALAYGLSDFVGGLASRRASAWSVAFVGQIASALCTVGVAVLRSGDPGGPDFAWAAVAGVGQGLGTAFLYRGLATGRMGVVAPISAVGAAIIPVAVGVSAGERPSMWVWIGVLSAMPGIWLVSSEPSAGQPTGATAEGILDGILAGAGFGVLFAALGQIPDSAGLWPVAAAQAVSIVTIVVAAAALGAAWIPRERGAAWGALAGLLGAAAAVLFLLATQRGYLTVAGVITSLYPAATVLLAATVLRERIHTIQAVGLALCAAAVALVAAG